MQEVDTRLKLSEVLPSRPALESPRPSINWIEPPRVAIELEFDKCALWWQNQDEVDLSAFDELLNVWVLNGEKPAEVVAQHRLGPAIKRHHFQLGLKEVDRMLLGRSRLSSGLMGSSGAALTEVCIRIHVPLTFQ